MIFKGSHTFGKWISALALKLTGTAGAGFIQIPVQTVVPTAAVAGSFKIYANSSGVLVKKNPSDVITTFGKPEALRIARNVATRNLAKGTGTASLSKSVAWSPSLGRFVSVGNTAAGNVMYSADGISWTAAAGTPSDPTGSTWMSVCWSPEKALFVAVANAGTSRAMYSSNGINWTLHASADDSAAWRSVAWSPTVGGTGKFVAVGSLGTNRAMYSTDGISWTIHASSNDANSWYGVCWSPTAGGTGRFVAVSNDGTNRTMYSTDGISWSGIASSNESASWTCVCWSADLNMFVAGGSGVGQLMTSADGSAWATQTTTGQFNAVTWCPEIACFIGIYRDDLSFSTDGITWTTMKAPVKALSADFIYGICWSPELCRLALVGGVTDGFKYYSY